MGFYLRKSISVGPFRFNLSKSGVGISAGIKGLRIGTGPRGNYVHMGRGGIYYRKTFTPGRVTPGDVTPQDRRPELAPINEGQTATHEAFKEVESGNALNMIDSSSAELLKELNEKKKMIRYWPIVASIGVIAFLIALNNKNLPTWIGSVIIWVVIAGTLFAARVDKIRKTTVLFYTMEPDAEKAYQSLHDAFDVLMACSKSWCVDAISRVTDKKYHAGASNLIKTQDIRLSKENPAYVASNISMPAMPVGRQTLYFLPDKMLVRDSNGFGAVNYKDLSIDIAQDRLICQGGAPSDATVVDHTWKYVNKKGGPDRRFKDNNQLPIIQHSSIELKSVYGLHEIIALSKAGVGEEFKRSIFELAKRT